MRATFLALLAALFTTTTFAGPTLGTMSAEVRGNDKRIDIERTIDALVQLHVNTYYYLIWQNARDFDDLPAFADAAAKHNIDVWPYIVPWSEVPPKKQGGWGYSEPFRTDYVTWAAEIAKLSLDHPNIPGYVIDDFYDNTDEGHFTPNYVRKMIGAGQRINPKLKFYPLMYFQTPWAEFVNRFGKLVDGVVLCYPKSENGIRNAVTYLEDRRHGPSAIIMLPRHHGAARGDGASVIMEEYIAQPEQASMSFYYDVTESAETDSSLQNARILVDGRTAWESPTEGRRRDAVIRVDLRPVLRGRPGKVRIEFDVITVRTGVPETLPVIVRFDDIRMYGTRERELPFDPDLQLKEREAGKFNVTLLPGTRGSDRFNFPIVLMPTGEAEQYEKRYDTRGTPEAVAAKVRLCLAMMSNGIVDGVVPYRTPLIPGDPYYEAIRAEYDAFRATPPPAESNAK